MIEIETENILLRNFRIEDEEGLYQAIRTYKDTKYAKMEEQDTGSGWPDERDQYKGIVEWFSNGDDYIAVILKDKNQLIGFINKSRTKDKEYNFGYVFHSEFSGKGYAYEAGISVINFIFENLSAELIKTGTPKKNIPSQKYLEKLGFTNLGNGEFSLKKENWNKIKKK